MNGRLCGNKSAKTGCWFANILVQIFWHILSDFPVKTTILKDGNF